MTRQKYHNQHMKLFLLFTVLFTLQKPALAQLGGDTLVTHPSVSVKRTENLVRRNSNGYTVQKIITADEIEIHEYKNDAGRVFALYWSGNSKPDLRVFLGEYFGRYSQELNKPLSGRHPVNIQDSDLIVQTGGTMRNYFGIAFLPMHSPQNFKLEDIQ